MTTDIRIGDTITFESRDGIRETGRVTRVIDTSPKLPPVYDVEIVERRNVFVIGHRIVGVERQI